MGMARANYPQVPEFPAVAGSPCKPLRSAFMSVVFVIDDDPSVRSTLKFLIGTVGLDVETFASTDSFLERKLPDAPVASCWTSDFLD